MVPLNRPCAEVRKADVPAVTKLLSERIKDLHLRPNAPYPSEQLRAKQAEKEAHEAIKRWRESQRMHLVKDGKP